MRAMILTAFLAAAGPLHAQCGGDFADFLRGIKTEAVARGHAPADVDAFLAAATPDPAVIAADRRQGVYRLDFTSFSRRLVSDQRLAQGQTLSRRHDVNRPGFTGEFVVQ